MDWLEDSVSFLPSFFDDPYNSDDINGCQWWDQSQYSYPTADDLIVDHTDTSLNCPSDHNTIKNPIAIITTTKSGENPEISNHLQKVVIPNPSKKRKSGGNHKNNNPGQIRRSHHRGSETRKSSGNNNNGMEGRWAEQLLNPCAAAVAEGNFTRVQHLLYVLHELASLSGDANHRLAHHGLRALTHHISPPSDEAAASAAVGPTSSFAATEPRLFQKSLIKFHEVSPWFAFPNAVANSSILQLLADQDRRGCGVHILDIGVSHGVQWPTLLESLTRRPGGPPSRVRITTVSDSHHHNHASSAVPFSTAPPGHDSSSRLLAFAKSINVNLEIDSLGFHDLTTSLKPDSRETTLIVCAQFRLHGVSQEERREFLEWAKRMRPRGVILSESEAEEGGPGGGGFGEGFRRRVEWLWRFLESTSAAFKGRESEERRVVEGEAARGLAVAAVAEGKEGWCVRMRGFGFEGVALGEDAVDAGRALLRKYDGNWEMRVDSDGSDGFVGLWWKGQPVSFCSLWKLSDS